MILLLNLKLVTGSFAIIHIALFRKKTRIRLIILNFSWAFIGNIIGSLLYAILFSVSVTNFSQVSDSPIID